MHIHVHIKGVEYILRNILVCWMTVTDMRNVYKPVFQKRLRVMRVGLYKIRPACLTHVSICCLVSVMIRRYSFRCFQWKLLAIDINLFRILYFLTNVA
jgi:hypothetical protein